MNAFDKLMKPEKSDNHIQSGHILKSFIEQYGPPSIKHTTTYFKDENI